MPGSSDTPEAVLPQEAVPSPEDALERLLDEPAEREPSEGEPSEREIVEGEIVEGDPVEGDPLEGDPLEGDPLDGAALEAMELDPELIAANLGIELPEDATQARSLLLLMLLQSRQEAGEYLETLQRVAAEFDNYRKRVERDQNEVVQRASRRLVGEMLTTLDSFDAALGYEPPSGEEQKVLDGMRGTYVQLMDTLAKEGLEPIEAVSKPFDPALHEAVSGPPEQGDGELVVGQDLRRGYTFRGMVIRASLVTVEHA